MLKIQAIQAERAARLLADARGVPADIMLSRILLVVSTILLVLIGLVMVFSASTVEAIAGDESVFSYVGKQAIFVVIGAFAAVVVVRLIPYRLWKTGYLFYVFWILAVLLLVAVAFVGTEALGAQRWIYIGPFSLQPTEFAKIIFVIAAARIMCSFREELFGWMRALVAFFVLVVLPLAFLFKTQSDMGSAVIIALGLLAVIWLGEVPLKVLLPVVIVLVVVACVAMSTGYRAERIAVWLNPWNDGEGGYGTGFQLIHSFYAFAQGGVFGVGLGNSREKYLYLPEAETDFIYSIIGEELGMIGALALIALFVVFLFAGLRIAAKAPDEFGKLLAGGLTVMLVGQAFLNMACATGLFPTTGKPLPFISSGGSSVISSLLIVGVLMSVSYGSNVLTSHEQRRNDLNVLRVDGRGARTERGVRTPPSEDARGRSSNDLGFNLVDGAESGAGSSSLRRRGSVKGASKTSSDHSRQSSRSTSETSVRDSRNKEAPRVSPRSVLSQKLSRKGTEKARKPVRPSVRLKARSPQDSKSDSRHETYGNRVRSKDRK